MSEQKWFRLDQLPQPWELTEDWFDRLEIPEALRRHYGHLSTAERHWLEAARLLADDYVKRELLRESLAAAAAVRRLAEEIDYRWLKPPKGRAVDFKKALEVLQIYAAYRAWTDGFSEHMEVLNVVIPYWIHLEAEYRWRGPGFVQLIVQCYEPSFGKLGGVVWENVPFLVREIGLAEGSRPTREEFEERPFDFIDPQMFLRIPTFRMPPAHSDTLGLMACIGKDLRDSLGSSYRGRSSLMAHEFTIEIVQPEPSLVQALLDAFAELHFPHRVPGDNWQLAFDVRSDLTQISCLSQVIPVTSFLTRYQKRA